jgi:2-oxoglutarate dehydrogenase E2 component (dihydrolipoamide succinyltransferase)
MTDPIKINLPKLGESIVSATVVQWFKNVGDRVELDEPLLEVSTDKINSEIPSPAAGILQEILAQPSQELQVGETLAILSGFGSSSPREALPAAIETKCPAASNDFLSPSVLRTLKEKGLKLEEADRIPRTGEGGRLTKKDVENYAPAVLRPPTPPQSDESERVKMSSLRKAIAENMVRSFYEAPHASLITEVDVTRIVKLIQDQKAEFFQKHGAKISITAFVARAIARALKAYPLLNASLDGDTIVMQKFINLGLAVSVEQGVMVPVIRGCQRLTLPEISQEIAKLAEKARAGRLEASETRQGTITMTNFGMTGTMIGVPIIRFPEVAIVGLGAITKKVVAMPDDSIAIRSMMWVSLTFDHRVLDGIYGCGFLGELKRHLEEDVSLD